MRLSTENHDRDSAGLKYVYPVVSRRSRGLSLGINLNPDNTCNWRCVYCQVPGLVFGNAPVIELALLESELRTMLSNVSNPTWLAANVPSEARVLRDLAIAGNGEPTSAREFEAVIELLGRALDEFRLRGQIEVVLITNGSLVQRANVRRGLTLLRELGGSAWFKLDSASDAGLARINSNAAGVARSIKNLASCAALLPTWIQTLAFDFAGSTLAGVELDAYCALLARLRREGVELRGVLLYGLARPSHQPEASSLRALDTPELERIAQRVRGECGLEVRVHA